MTTLNHPEIARRHDEGFTLIELLIVMSVILILMSLAIPQAVKVHKTADETSAVQSVRMIGSAENSYSSAYPARGFANALPALGGVQGSGAPTPEAAQLLDTGLASGSKSGYLFTVIGNNKVTVNNQDMYNGFLVTAVPASVGHSGDRGFCMDESGIIKFDPKGGTNCTEAIQ